jgi:hypothetical protein
MALSFPVVLPLSELERPAPRPPPRPATPPPSPTLDARVATLETEVAAIRGALAEILGHVKSQGRRNAASSFAGGVVGQVLRGLLPGVLGGE